MEGGGATLDDQTHAAWAAEAKDGDGWQRSRVSSNQDFL